MSEPKHIKEFLELAKIEPIRIKNLEGESFILMSEFHYQKMIEEMSSLKSRIEGISKIIDKKPNAKKKAKTIKKTKNKKRRKK